MSRKEFQFTHPGRGATQGREIPYQGYQVSIHAPREGCDELLLLHSIVRQLSFNSRTPGGVRPNCGYPEFGDIPVSIHAPREGCDSV